MTTECRSYRFKRAIARLPAQSVSSGLRAAHGPDPAPDVFRQEHQAYIQHLREAGVDVTVLPRLEGFPDSVFVEDVALCLGKTAIALRPGALSRRGEVEMMLSALDEAFDKVIALPDSGLVDGGDILLADEDAFIGLSARTNQAGFEHLSPLLVDLGYRPKKVETPSGVLHFKTDCGLLDSTTIFTTRRLAETQCFQGYRIILAPEDEEAAANLIRVNDIVLLSSGYPKTKALLEAEGYNVKAIPTTQAALVDGGLSCMSLRF